MHELNSPSFNAAPDHSSSSQYLQQDPTQSLQDPSLVHYSQQGWPANQGMEALLQTGSHTLTAVSLEPFRPRAVQGHQQAVPYTSDPRFQNPQHAYGSYPPRSSPSMIGTPHESRILPSPIGLQSQMQTHLSMSSTQIRSPSTGYPAYSSYQQPNPYGYPAAPDPRQLPPPVPMGYDTTSGLTHRRPSLVDRNNPLRPNAHGVGPYQRVPSANPMPEPVAEPTKKKRKRADAEQLKVLNETYARTAFPSTEERIELAKKLGMSARSVQIWYVPPPRPRSPSGD